jgi:outer membrane biosynthesis protein TonB
MKHPIGFAKPRRLAAPKKTIRLDLRRRPKSEVDDELGLEPKSNFWRWFAVVALLHVIIIGIVCWIYETTSAPKPPEQFISLLPQGDVVKGTPGAQQAHKTGPTTSAPAEHHSAQPPPAPAVQPKPVMPPPVALLPTTPVEPKPLPPKPVLKKEVPKEVPDKPVTPPKPVVKTEVPPVDKPVTPPKPAPPKPTPPKPVAPKVKVDLTLADAPNSTADKPVAKPQPVKKPAATSPDDSADHDHEATAKPNSAGLSKEQIAAKLGDKLDAAGIKNAVKTGTSGSQHATANPFADFYASIHDQVMNQWQSPNLSDENAVDPVVHIYVEKDGRVPPESVNLTRSSGNQAYDDSAVAAAKGLGYLHQPLPDGCPPDISIIFKPNSNR